MTDHTHQQQQQAETGTNSSDQQEPEESEYNRWLRLQPVIFDMFSVSSQTVVKLTRCAMSKGLVSSTIQESVNDKAKVYTITERANKLLQYLHSKAKIDVEGKVFHQFIECLKEDEFYKSTRENLVKEYEELKRSKSTMNPSAQVFLSYADDLGDILAGPNLNAIARKLRSSSVLTEQEYSSVVDPESYHTTECLNTVLKQIGLMIKQDPKKLNVFIEILEREGPFYSSLVDSLKGSDPDLCVQTMDNNNPQEIFHGAVDHETRPSVAERNQLQVPLSRTSSPNETHKDAPQEIGPPQDKDLLAILSSIPVTNKLQTFCINLGLPSARCSEIFDDPTIRGDFNTQRHRMLRLWDEVKKRTWEDFVKALDTTGYHQKAKELAKRYRT